MTDAPPPSTPTPQEIPGQSNQPNTSQPALCQCVVCALERLAKHPQQRLYRGAWTEFSTADMDLNIVGVRLKDSFSDRFDDYLCAFFRPFAKGAAAEAIDENLRAELKELAKTTAAGARVVFCQRAQRAGPWVTMWWSASTDPGQSKKNAPARWAELDAMVRAEERALALGPADPAPNPAKMTLPNEALTVEGQPTIKTRKGAAAALARDRKQRDDIAHTVIFMKGGVVEEGSYEHGKGFMPAGYYPKAFPIDFHHAPRVFDWTDGYGYHPALHRMDAGGLRSFSGASLRLNEGVWKEEAIAGRAILRRMPGGQVSNTSWLPRSGPGSWTLSQEADGEKRWVAIDHTGKVIEPIASDEVLFVEMGKVGGTNIHRAHAVRFKGDALAASRLDFVGAWSEGCQVTRNFDDFTLFLRVAAAAAQHGCAARLGTMVGPRRCRRMSDGDFAAPASTERAVEGRCERSPLVRDDGDAAQTARRNAALTLLEAMALTDAKEVKKRSLIQCDPVRDAYLALRAPADAAKKAADAAKKAEAEAVKAQRKATSARARARGTAIPAAQETLDRAAAAVAQAHADRAAADAPLADAASDLTDFIDAQLAAAPFKPLYEDGIRRVIRLGRHEHLRDCQVTLACPHYFSYLLLEADSDQVAALAAAARQGKPWSGQLHLDDKLIR